METRTLSELLEDLQTHTAKGNISLQTLLEAFHERGFGFFIFLIALPAALPLPALGINTIIALPLMLLTAQQAMGRHTIWIPEKWRAKTISATHVGNLITQAKPWVKRIEFLLRPRLSWVTQGASSYLIGILGVVMACSVAIPVPFTNTVPSMGIALMAIGVLMRDGLAVIVGALIGLVWEILIFSFFIVYGAKGFDMAKEFVVGLF